MSEIKSLADELRQTLKEGEGPKPDKKKMPKKGTTNLKRDEQLEALFDEMMSHSLTGQEKLLIRLDDKTVFILKQLKVVKGIDMNKAISYVIQQFVHDTPNLTKFIKDSLNTLEL